MQASWSGTISFGLFAVPVQLYKATESHAGPKFYQVHGVDGGRIKQKRFCSVDDQEVPYAEIAKGYETDDEKQLILTSEDLAELPIPSKNIIDVAAFVDIATFDPVQYDSAYYVGLGKHTPDKPYVLLREAMRESGSVAVAKVTLASKESLAVLRVVDDLIVLTTMFWPDEVRDADIRAPGETLHANELKMAKALMEEMSRDFSPGQLHDEYREAVETVIEAKMHGTKPAAVPQPAPASSVVDITEILKRSIEAEKARRSGAESPQAKPSVKKTAAKASARKAAANEASAPAGEATAKKAPAKKAAAPRRKAG
jgi:DNA end-binding protein Ku